MLGTAYAALTDSACLAGSECELDSGCHEVMSDLVDCRCPCIVFPCNTVSIVFHTYDGVSFDSCVATDHHDVGGVLYFE